MRLGYKYIFAVVILLCTFTGMMLAQNNLYNIEVQAFDGYVRISWKIDSESGIDHYEIWRSSGSSIPIIIGKVDAGISYFDDKNVGFSKTEDQFAQTTQ